MRRLFVFCALCALALPAPALAYTKGAADGTLVVRNGSSDDFWTPVVRLVAFHGAVFGQVDGGKYTISLYGVGIDLNAVGQPAAGKVWLQGSPTLLADGKYSIDGADFRSLPDVGAWLSIGG